MIVVRLRTRRPRIRRRGALSDAGVSRRLAVAVWRLSAAVALTAATALFVWPAPAAAQPAVRGPWVEPVAAPVIDGYRPPAHIGAPGNRGWEYLTESGTVVVAAGDGVVVFAGPIGGSDYVSIQHPDGRRTTYSHVATITVEVGDTVAAGEPIATSGERLHFGVRVGEEYRDPGELFTATMPGAAGGVVSSGDGLRLVPGAAVARNRTHDGFPSGWPVGRPSAARPWIVVASPTRTVRPAPALGRWLAAIAAMPVPGAGSAQGWSGDATDTLAAGPRQPAVGP